MVLTEKGFQRPTFNDLLTAQENRAKLLFGEDIDTSSQSILGKFIRLNLPSYAPLIDRKRFICYLWILRYVNIMSNF